MDIKNNEYVFDYSKEKIEEVENAASFLHQEKYKFDNYLEIIPRKKFENDSMNYNNDIIIQSDRFRNNTLNTSYGLVKLVPNDKQNSDSFVKYSYEGYSKYIESYIINLELYEGERILLLSDKKYQPKLISGLPYFSPNGNYAVNFKDSEAIFSQISIFKVGNSNLKYDTTFWSDNYIPDYIVWDNEDNIILKLRQIDSGLYSYAKIPVTALKSPSKIIKKKKLKISGQDWKGVFKITTKAISNYDQKEIDLLYTISVTSDTFCVLSIGADQVQDYWCEGDYYLTSENNIIHATGKCDDDDINDFFLKFETDNYFIKSKRFLNQDWQKLVKEK